jgi:hypothetical protein
MDGRWGEIDYH